MGVGRGRGQWLKRCRFWDSGYGRSNGCRWDGAIWLKRIWIGKEILWADEPEFPLVCLHLQLLFLQSYGILPWCIYICISLRRISWGTYGRRVWHIYRRESVERETNDTRFWREWAGIYLDSFFFKSKRLKNWPYLISILVFFIIYFKYI